MTASRRSARAAIPLIAVMMSGVLGSARPAEATSAVPNTCGIGSPASCDSGGEPFNFVMPSSGAVTFDPKPGSTSIDCGANISNSATPVMTQSFKWNTWVRMQNIRSNGGADQMAYEHETTFSSYGFWYDYTLAQNVPYYYQDTQLSDPNDQNLAGGSYNSYYLSPGTNYSFQQKWYTCKRHSLPSQTFKLGTQRSYTNGPCDYGYQYCVTAKPYYPRDLVPLRAGYSTSATTAKTYGWTSNRLLNPSFEGPSSASWHLTAASGGTASWSFPSSGGYEGPAFARFSCATAALCSIYQEVSGYVTSSRDWFTVGSVVRCPTTTPATPDCVITLQVQSLANGAAVNRTYTVPRNYGWYYLEFITIGWTDTAANFRVRLINRLAGSAPVDVDHWLLHRTDNQ